MFLGASLEEFDPNFDPQAKQDVLEEETLKKVQEFKDKFNNVKDQVDGNKQELQYAEAQVNELVKKI